MDAMDQIQTSNPFCNLLESDNPQELRHMLAVASSYPEHVAIMHRIAELIQRREVYPLHFEEQDIGEGIEQELTEQPGQVRAFFLENSLLRDHLAYAEYKRPRMRGNTWHTICESPLNILEDIPPELAPPEEIPLAEREQWILEARELTARAMRLEGSRSRDGDFERHLARRAPFICERGKENGHYDRIFAYLKTHASRPKRKSKQWMNSKEYQYNVFANVEAGDCEHRLVDALLTAGAVVGENEFEVQEYESVHDIQPGKRFTLTTEDGPIHYIPHYSVGMREVKELQHEVAISLGDDQLDEVININRNSWSKRIFTPEDLYVVTTTYKEGEKTIKQVRCEVARWLRRKRRASLERSIETGKAYSFEDRHGHTQRESATLCTEEDLAAQGKHWQPIGNGQFMRMKNYQIYKGQIDAIEKFRAAGEPLVIKFTGGSFQAPGRRTPARVMEMFAAYAAALEARQHAFFDGEDEPETTVWPTPDLLTDADASWQQFAEVLYGELRRRQLPRGFRLLATPEWQLPAASSHRVEEAQRREPIEHKAPFSERGILRLERMTPRIALGHLQTLGLATGLAQMVPYDFIYRGRHRWGRVLPVHEEYAAGEAVLAIPEGYMVLHGMTGANNAKAALSRLESMVDTGGLKCIAERRRMGIGFNSMSPRGDIASGIDGGVPCKIGNVPCYGAMVVFAMKPEILERRDLFFSNHDFGGGKDRYPHFTQYAKHIGQEKIFLPAPHHARQKHLDEGTESTDNEVYLQHEIAWDEVDTVFVSQQMGLYHKVLERMETWQAQGLVNPSVRVVPYDGKSHHLQPIISERAQELAAARIPAH